MPAAQMTGDNGRCSRTRRVLRWLWLGAAATLLLFPLRLWTKPVGRSMLAAPARTVVDRADPGMAARWELLGRAAAHIPPGSTVTFLAPDPETEMELYMLARARLGHLHLLPASYYGHPRPEHLDQAEFFVVLAPATGDQLPVRLVQDLGNGQLLRRVTEGR